ncbi:hypothetical protein XELAEV_18020761mg [Xenopus laevis]|uniref:Uncharacterized protein n=1 Tax=Xenopus laevis TaxID=8355 RepID=A0A974D8C9_XENLA|nr:hypothetical protein XELAEV_18020761mg [Xenopus laevis]
MITRPTTDCNKALYSPVRKGQHRFPAILSVRQAAFWPHTINGLASMPRLKVTGIRPQISLIVKSAFPSSLTLNDLRLVPY